MQVKLLHILTDETRLQNPWVSVEAEALEQKFRLVGYFEI